jgi:pimeloyl-ACP methyl ester carboxylesterase
MRARSYWKVAFTRILAGGLCLALTAAADAQIPKRPPLPKKGPLQPMPKALPQQQAKKAPKLPEPEDVPLETKDGVSLMATYYPGTAKKETIPIIMVHGLDGQRGDFHAMAMYLQGLGHASIVPDLRGHGQSKAQKLPNGATRTIKVDAMNRLELERMMFDLEACKKFLLDQNNKGEVNIEELCVMGSEFGSILAVRWAALDWSAKILPAFKQGQDVKALVLLSPLQTYKGVSLREALVFPPVQTQVAVMLIAGTKDTKATSEAKKIYNSLHGHHPKVDDDDEARKVVVLLQPETALAGTKLLTTSLRLPTWGSPPQAIARFIDLRLVDRKADFPWQERKSPLAE